MKLNRLSFSILAVFESALLAVAAPLAEGQGSKGPVGDGGSGGTLITGGHGFSATTQGRGGAADSHKLGNTIDLATDSTQYLKAKAQVPFSKHFQGLPGIGPAAGMSEDKNAKILPGKPKATNIKAKRSLEGIAAPGAGAAANELPIGDDDFGEVTGPKYVELRKRMEYLLGDDEWKARNPDVAKRLDGLSRLFDAADVERPWGALSRDRFISASGLVNEQFMDRVRAKNMRLKRAQTFGIQPKEVPERQARANLDRLNINEEIDGIDQSNLPKNLNNVAAQLEDSGLFQSGSKPGQIRKGAEIRENNIIKQDGAKLEKPKRAPPPKTHIAGDTEAGTTAEQNIINANVGQKNVSPPKGVGPESAPKKVLGPNKITEEQAAKDAKLASTKEYLWNNFGVSKDEELRGLTANEHKQMLKKIEELQKSPSAMKDAQFMATLRKLQAVDRNEPGMYQIATAVLEKQGKNYQALDMGLRPDYSKPLNAKNKITENKEYIAVLKSEADKIKAGKVSPMANAIAADKRAVQAELADAKSPTAQIKVLEKHLGEARAWQGQLGIAEIPLNDKDKLEKYYLENARVNGKMAFLEQKKAEVQKVRGNQPAKDTIAEAQADAEAENENAAKGLKPASEKAINEKAVKGNSVNMMASSEQTRLAREAAEKEARLQAKLSRLEKVERAEKTRLAKLQFLNEPKIPQTWLSSTEAKDYINLYPKRLSLKGDKLTKFNSLDAKMKAANVELDNKVQILGQYYGEYDSRTGKFANEGSAGVENAEKYMKAMEEQGMVLDDMFGADPNVPKSFKDWILGLLRKFRDRTYWGRKYKYSDARASDTEDRRSKSLEEEEQRIQAAVNSNAVQERLSKALGMKPSLSPRDIKGQLKASAEELAKIYKAAPNGPWPEAEAETSKFKRLLTAAKNADPTGENMAQDLSKYIRTAFKGMKGEAVLEAEALARGAAATWKNQASAAAFDWIKASKEMSVEQKIAEGIFHLR